MQYTFSIKTLHYVREEMPLSNAVRRLIMHATVAHTSLVMELCKTLTFDNPVRRLIMAALWNRAGRYIFAL